MPAHPAELTDHPCVYFSGTAGGGNWHFYEPQKRFAVPVSGRLTCNQAATAVEATAQGIGFGLFLGYQVASLVGAGKLQVVLAEFEPPPLPVSLVYPGARLLATRTRAFIDWMAPGLRAALDQIPV